MLENKEFKVGDRVNHKKLGDSTVVGMQVSTPFSPKLPEGYALISIRPDVTLDNHSVNQVVFMDACTKIEKEK
jgi:hypothetical protein